MSKQSVTIIGGGIVGLAIARQLANNGHPVTVIEKEASWAGHQTGHNSGVIHAGPYYKPGSLKARMCLAGNASMKAFASENDIPHENCGKLIVASSSQQNTRLQSLAQRALLNGVKCKLISPEEAREYEPYVFSTLALRVEDTGIIDYKVVSQKLAVIAQSFGAELVLNSEVSGITNQGGRVVVTHDRGEVESDLLINAAGLHSDRIALLAGFNPAVRIVPFRGEYFELSKESVSLVKGLIYPVPDPDLPFLGVHLTKMIDGTVHAGPNAVLAFAREGYTWSDINMRDTFGTLAYPGFLKLASKNIKTGSREIIRSLSKSMFANDLSKLVPEITSKDIVPSGSGVRAQAINPDGTLADDFVIQQSERQIHILNAPSPAATSALEIAKYINKLVDEHS